MTTFWINVRGGMVVEANGPNDTVLHAIVEAEPHPGADYSWKVLGPPEFARKWRSFTVYGPTDDWRPIPADLGPARVIDQHEWRATVITAGALAALQQED